MTALFYLHILAKLNDSYFSLQADRIYVQYNSLHTDLIKSAHSYKRIKLA